MSLVNILSLDVLAYQVLPCVDSTTSAFVATELGVAHMANRVFGSLIDAIQDGCHVELLEWLMSGSKQWIQQRYFMTAVATNRLDVVAWLSRYDKPNSQVFVEAAKKGDWGMMKLLRKINCPLTAAVFDEASRHGDIALLEWLETNGCLAQESVYFYAVQQDNMAVLDWLSERVFVNMSCTMLRSAFVALDGGHLSSLIWLKDRPQLPCWPFTMGRVIMSKKLDVVKYFVQIEEMPVHLSDFHSAVRADSKDILDYMLELMHQQLPPGLFRTAFEGGHVNSMAWVYGRLMPHEQQSIRQEMVHWSWPSITIPVAMVEWLHEQQLLMYAQSAHQSAIRNDDVEVIRFLLQNHYPLPHHPNSVESVRMAEVLHEHQQGCLDQVMPLAVIEENLPLLKWLHAHNYPWHPNMMTPALRSGNLELLDWLHSNKCPWDVDFDIVMSHPDFDFFDVPTVEWVVKNGFRWPQSVFDLGLRLGYIEEALIMKRYNRSLVIPSRAKVPKSKPPF